MDLYLAGIDTRPWLVELDWNELMKFHLAGEHEVKNGSVCKTWEGVNILESFYYARLNKYVERLLPSAKSFLLDSGAFTFMQNAEGTVNWEQYISEYAEFINSHDVKLFFELDIDPIVGLKEVERLRDLLTRLTGKKPIPVWHKSRGKQYFIDMCKEFDYVAIGGIVTQEIPRAKYETAFPWFIKTAHDNGAKIHGLGYTSLKNLKKYHFDSIDSTTWLSGNMSGKVFKFNSLNGTMSEVFAPDGKKLKSREAAINNFAEWIKFSKYAETYY